MTEVDALHIGGLPRGIATEFVRQVFAQYGPVHSVNVHEATSPEQAHVAAVLHMQQPQSQWIIDNLNGNIPQGMETIVFIQRLPTPNSASMQAPLPVGPQLSMPQSAASQMPMQNLQTMQQGMQMQMMQALFEAEWACSACGFTNAPRNKLCGGNGPMGCKAPREQVGEAKAWTCGICQNVCFGVSKACTRCQSPNPNAPARQVQERVDDGIDMAAGTVLQAVAHLETSWDFDKLRWKVASYFRNAAKEIVINGPIEKVVDDFADCSFCRLMSAISDRVWLCQVDFTLLLDAAVKTTLPPEYLNSIPMAQLEDAIVKSHDRAFEEARVTPVIWDAIEGRVDGKKAANKVYNAYEVGRSLALKAVSDEPTQDILAAAMPTMEKIDKFCRAWINASVSEMAKAMKGDPATLIEKEIAELIFSSLLTVDTLPQWLCRHLIAENETFAPPHPFLDQYLKDAYLSHQQPAWQPMKKQRVQPRIKTHMCWFFCGENACTYGDNCQYAHTPADVFLTPDFKCPDWVREMFPQLGEQYDMLMQQSKGSAFGEQGKGFVDLGSAFGEQGKGFVDQGPCQGKGFGDLGKFAFGDQGDGWSAPGPSQGKGCWGDSGMSQGKGCWGDAGMNGWNAGAPGKGWSNPQVPSPMGHFSEMPFGKGGLC